jgi:hypothetical protein
MGGLIPLGASSRRPARIRVVTAGIILINALVFVMELMCGETFVAQWSATKRPRQVRVDR